MFRFQQYRPAFNQVEPIRQVAFTKDCFSGLIGHSHGVLREDLDVSGFQTGKKWVFREYFFDRFLARR